MVHVPYLTAAAALLSVAAAAPAPGPLQDLVCTAALAVLKAVAPTQLAQASTYCSSFIRPTVSAVSTSTSTSFVYTATVTVPAPALAARETALALDRRAPAATPTVPAVWKTLVAQQKSTACSCVLTKKLPAPTTVFTSTTVEVATVSTATTVTTAAAVCPKTFITKPDLTTYDTSQDATWPWNSGWGTTSVEAAEPIPPEWVPGVGLRAFLLGNHEMSLVNFLSSGPCQGQTVLLSFTYRCMGATAATAPSIRGMVVWGEGQRLGGDMVFPCDPSKDGVWIDSGAIPMTYPGSLGRSRLELDISTRNLVFNEPIVTVEISRVDLVAAP